MVLHDQQKHVLAKGAHLFLEFADDDNGKTQRGNLHHRHRRNTMAEFSINI